jgi:cephalosporin hydroxylase
MVMAEPLKTANTPDAGNLILALRRRLRPLRRRINIALCSQKLKRLPKDQSLLDIVGFALSDKAIAVQQVPSEITEYANLIDKLKPKTAVEIGTSRGGSLFILCRLAAPDATIISLDMPGAGYGEAYTSAHAKLFELFPSKRQSLTLVKGDSHSPETRKRVDELLVDKKVDLLFIDGDHSYEGVKKDFEMYSPLVAAGGMIVLHDIAVHTKFANCDVDRFWNEIKVTFQHREIIEDPKQGWAGIGVLWKDRQ